MIDNAAFYEFFSFTVCSISMVCHPDEKNRLRFYDKVLGRKFINQRHIKTVDKTA
jgi:hypothetical protein